MPMNSFLKQSFVPLLTGVGILCAGLFGLTLHDPDAVIGDSYGRVLADNQTIVPASWMHGAHNEARARLQPALHSTTVARHNLLSVGDQILLTQAGRSENPFRILNVELLGDTVTRIDTRIGTTQRLLITARDINHAPGQTIRFILEIDIPQIRAPTRPEDQIL